MSDTTRVGVAMLLGAAVSGSLGLVFVAVTSPNVVAAMLIGVGSALLGVVVGMLWGLGFGGDKLTPQDVPRVAAQALRDALAPVAKELDIPLVFDNPIEDVMSDPLKEFLLARLTADEATARRPAMTLTEFLLARFDEAEAVAQRALKAYQHVQGIPYYFDPLPGQHGGMVGITPRAALADIESKRQIVEEYQAYRAQGADYASVATYAHVVRLLALPHAQHPDYPDKRSESTPAPPTKPKDVPHLVAQALRDATRVYKIVKLPRLRNRDRSEGLKVGDRVRVVGMDADGDLEVELDGVRDFMSVAPECLEEL